jgi:hypothetical protein
MALFFALVLAGFISGGVARLEWWLERASEPAQAEAAFQQSARDYDSLQAALEAVVRRARANQRDSAGLPVTTDTLAQERPAFDTARQRLLQPARYHNSEVSPVADQHSWYALFGRADSFYVDTVRPQLQRVHDPIGDPPQDSTAWRVSAPGQDTVLFFYQSDTTYPRGEAPSIFKHAHGLAQDSLRLGHNDTLDCHFQGEAWRLVLQTQLLKGADKHVIHRLWWGRVAAHKPYAPWLQKQLLLAQRQHILNGLRIKARWIGDFDGDGRPDIFLENSMYNRFRPILFLSRPAAGDALVRMVAYHLSRGC